MKARLCAFALMLACVACSPVARETHTVSDPATPHTEVAHHSPTFATPREAALAITSSDAARATAASKHLRALGRAGADALRAEYAADIAFALGEGPDTGRSEAELARILAAIDTASGQRDGWASGLFWHTDIETAKAEAAARGLPILNLWLLGTLDDEFC